MVFARWFDFSRRSCRRLLSVWIILVAPIGFAYGQAPAGPRGPADAERVISLAREALAAGQDDRALGYLEEADRLLKGHFPEGHERRAECLNELGVVHLKRGDYREGVDAFSEAAAVYRKLAEKSGEGRLFLSLATVINNLGALALRTGDTDSALQAMETARAIYDKLVEVVAPNTDPSIVRTLETNRAITLDNLGYIELILGRTRAAVELIEAAHKSFIRLYPPSGFPKGHPDLAANLNRQGLLDMTSGRFDAARAAMSKALEMFKGFVAEDHPALAGCRRNLALLSAWQGDYRTAKALLREAIAALEKSCPPESAPEGNVNLAACYHFLGEVQRLDRSAPADADARKNLYRALEMSRRLAELFAQAFDEPIGIAYASKMLHDPLDSLLSLDADLEHAGRHDYPAVWQSKGLVTRIFRDRRPPGQAVGIAEKPEIAARYRKVVRQISYLRIATAGNPKDPRQARMKVLAQAQRELAAELAPPLPKRGGPPIQGLDDSRRLVERMPAGAVFIDLLTYQKLDAKAQPNATGRGTNHYTAFILARERPIVRVELGEADAIDRAVETWRNSVVCRRVDTAPGELGRVWEKLEAHFPRGTTTVIISPDGALAALPWPALPARGNRGRLIETYTFARAPHGLALLEWLDARPDSSPGPGRFLFVGGVEYTDRARLEVNLAETERLERCPDKPVRAEAGPALLKLPDPAALIDDLSKLAARKGLSSGKLLGPDARVDVVLEQLSTASWVYFDTHGYLARPAIPRAERAGTAVSDGALSLGRLQFVMSRDNPLIRNGLALQDGVLTADRLMRAYLPGLELVVLGACESGLGVLARGEGVIGLQRAFHQAGARNVVASLWPVTTDEARVLLTNFQRSLVEDSVSKPEALRRAQVEMFRHGDGDSSLPFFWSAWVVSGDPRPVREAAGTGR